MSRPKSSAHASPARQPDVMPNPVRDGSATRRARIARRKAAVSFSEALQHLRETEGHLRAMHSEQREEWLSLWADLFQVVEDQVDSGNGRKPLPVEAATSITLLGTR